MNIRWNKLLSELRRLGVPFTTTIEGENIEAMALKGEYILSARWNALSVVEQQDTLRKLGFSYSVVKRKMFAHKGVSS